MIAGSFYVAPVVSHLKHLNTLTFVRKSKFAVPLFGATDRPHTPCWWGSGGDIILDGIPLFGEPELSNALGIEAEGYPQIGQDERRDKQSPAWGYPRARPDRRVGANDKKRGTPINVRLWHENKCFQQLNY